LHTDLDTAAGNGLPLGEVLELDVMRRTGARVLHGERQLDRLVRWVHTSELAEASCC
jgi:purine catabolism regulator